MTTPPTPATILVVDDDPGIARLIARELRREGHHAATVGSGEAAITWLEDHTANLVLLDLKLPGLRGTELIDRLDGFHDHLPFIVITGQGDERVAVDMMKRGALDYLVKDVNFLTLVPTVVQRALARLEEQARLTAAEHALRESEHRERERAAELAALLDAVPTPVFIAHDPDCLHITGNRAADELLRNPRGGEASLTAPEDQRPRHFKAVKDGRELSSEELPAQRAAKGVPVHGFEFDLVFDDGTIRDVLAFSTPLLDDAGQSRGSINVLMDITDRKLAEVALARSHAELERRVLERTAELTQTNDTLQESRIAALNLMEDSIAARQQTEQAAAALRESEERFRGFFENVAVGAGQIDATGHYIRVNDRYCEITGYSRAELLGGMTPHDLHHPEDSVVDDANLEPFLRGDAAHYHEEKRYLRKDGTVVWVDVSASAVRDADGTMRNIAAVIEDITERKLAEQALHASEEQLRLFVEHTPAPVVMFDREMRYLVVSERWAQDFRLTIKDLIGRSHYEVFPEMPERWKQIHQRCLAGATESCERDQFPRADGSTDWVKWEIRPWYDAKGEVGGIIIFAEVINDRVRIEDEILTARRFAESTLEAVPASLAVLDAKGKILSTNQAWTAFALANGGTINVGGVGSNYLEVCDAAAKEGVEEAARFVAGIREVMSGASPGFNMEYACHSPTQQRWFVGYVTPFLGNGPHSVVIAHVDVSERKRAEQVIRRLNVELELRVEQRTEALRLANAELRKQITMRRQLEDEILHVSEREQQRIGQDLHDDLGQQLAGIWLLSDVLKSNLTKQGSPEAGNAEQITGLLRNSLTLTRSLARGLHPVSVQQGGLVAALDELTTRTCDMFKVNCRCNCPPGIEMDNTTATHLYRIAQEAVTNAVKHGQAKEIDIELSTNRRSTVLSVKDQGGGIADLDPDRKGMGLRIMSYRADMIGGTLHIQRNQNGVGTTVLCSIPTPPSAKPAHV